MEIVQTETYQKEADRLLSFEEVNAVEGHLMANPIRGKRIPRGGGLRKLRYKYRGKGTRGGLRIIYYYLVEDIIILVAIYKKLEKVDVTTGELRAMVVESKEIIEGIRVKARTKD